MSGFHTIIDEKCQQEVESAIESMVLALAQRLAMSIPSATYAVNQITARYLASMDRPATAKNLRQTADFIAGKTTYDKFFKATAHTFDRIAAGYDQKSETRQ